MNRKREEEHEIRSVTLDAKILRRDPPHYLANLETGTFKLENCRKHAKIWMEISDGSVSLSGSAGKELDHNIEQVVMDTGADTCLFPQEIRDYLDLDANRRYDVGRGVSGVIVCEVFPIPVKIQAYENHTSKPVTATIDQVPIFSRGPTNLFRGWKKLSELISDLEETRNIQFTRKIIDYVSPEAEVDDHETIKVPSPKLRLEDLIIGLTEEEKDYANSRLGKNLEYLELELNVQKNIPYALIGKDWQSQFKTTFYKNKITISE